ncbi:MAG: hypothetical protein ACO1QB_00930 [Verrucomicrobiales bacterium]
MQCACRVCGYKTASPPDAFNLGHARNFWECSKVGIKMAIKGGAAIFSFPKAKQFLRPLPFRFTEAIKKGKDWNLNVSSKEFQLQNEVAKLFRTKGHASPRIVSQNMSGGDSSLLCAMTGDVQKNYPAVMPCITVPLNFLETGGTTGPLTTSCEGLSADAAVYVPASG